MLQTLRTGSGSLQSEAGRKPRKETEVIDVKRKMIAILICTAMMLTLGACAGTDSRSGSGAASSAPAGNTAAGTADATADKASADSAAANSGAASTPDGAIGNDGAASLDEGQIGNDGAPSLDDSGNTSDAGQGEADADAAPEDQADPDATYDAVNQS